MIVNTLTGDHNNRITDYTSVVCEPVLPADNCDYDVRRLTPTECARLQGFPDAWGDIGIRESFSSDELKFWQNVRNTHAEINGKETKEYSEKQMVSWYNKLHSDTNEYRMWGNGIALPCALFVMGGIATVLRKRSE